MLIPAQRNKAYMQLCWVVPDLDAAMAAWTQTAGVGPFFVFPSVEFEGATFRGQPAEPLAITAAMAQADDMQIELVCPQDDRRSMFNELVPFGRGGFHHAGLYCQDYAAQRDAYVAAGADIAFEGLMMGARTCYIDTSSTLGFMTELIQANPVAEAVFAAIRAAAVEWDGADPVRSLG